MSADGSASPVRSDLRAAGYPQAFDGARRQVRRRALQLVDLALLWVARSRQRRRLQGVSDHMLKDIGVSRADVEHEVGKPFWRS